MKIAAITRGPVKLSKIDYAPNLSHETIAFTGEIAIKLNGTTHKAAVSNEGQGGPNYVDDNTTAEVLAAHAKTLPGITFNDITVPMDYDCLISEMLQEALAANELKKLLRRKLIYTRADDTEHLYEVKKAKNEAGHKAHLVKKGAEQFLNDLPFEEALSLFKERG
jgi:hypothetical protein